MPYAGMIDGNLAIANTQVDASFVEVSSLPEDKLFRDAFELNGNKVVVNFDKAKELAHKMRKADRDVKMAPLDREHTYQPEVAEPKRQAVRDENAQMQIDIDACEDVASLREVVGRDLL